MVRDLSLCANIYILNSQCCWKYTLTNWFKAMEMYKAIYIVAIVAKIVLFIVYLSFTALAAYLSWR